MSLCATVALYRSLHQSVFVVRYYPALLWTNVCLKDKTVTAKRPPRLHNSLQTNNHGPSVLTYCVLINAHYKV